MYFKCRRISDLEEWEVPALWEHDKYGALIIDMNTLDELREFVRRQRFDHWTDEYPEFSRPRCILDFSSNEIVELSIYDSWNE